MNIKITNCIACNKLLDYDIIKIEDLKCCSITYTFSYSKTPYLLCMSFRKNNDSYYIGPEHLKKCLQVIKNNYHLFAPIDHLQYLTPNNIDSYIDTQKTFQ